MSSQFYIARDRQILYFLSTLHKFFVLDNISSLLKGRQFAILHDSLLVLEELLLEPKDEASLKKSYTQIMENRNTVLGYIDNLIEIYSLDEITRLKVYENKEIYKSEEALTLLYSTIESLEVFIESYNITSRYCSDGQVKEMLVEFNNFMSHLFRGLAHHSMGEQDNLDKNINRAKGHLFRGSVDGYKSIICSSGENLYKLDSAKGAKDILLSIRTKEVDNMGVNGDILDVVKKYQKFVCNYIYNHETGKVFLK